MKVVSSRWLAGFLFAVLGLAGCGGSSQSEPRSYAPSEARAPSPGMAADGAGRSRGDFDAAPKSEAQARPGLGTTWGETRSSHITTSPFVRADSSSPFASSALFYNDEEGARAMANSSGFRRFSEGSASIGGGVASVRLKDGNGRFLSGFEAGGKKFMVGSNGDRYTIVVQSHVPSRLEVVVSVDGLDVLDGKEAGFAKRGYLLDPHGRIEIDGFRQSMESVAAFRFGSVKSSYAQQKHGDSRNVGVIGVALFNEQGTNPSTWPIGDAGQRLNADPFPGRFATPPAN